MNRERVESGGTATTPHRRPDGPALLIVAGGLSLARQLGPLPWTALQHLAFASQPTNDGWAAAVGVRDIAAGIGVTKDTGEGRVDPDLRRARDPWASRIHRRPSTRRLSASPARATLAHRQSPTTRPPGRTPPPGTRQRGHPAPATISWSQRIGRAAATVVGPATAVCRPQFRPRGGNAGRSQRGGVVSSGMSPAERTLAPLPTGCTASTTAGTSPPTPAPPSGTGSPARSTPTASCPQPNVNGGPSVLARPTTPPWPPNRPRPAASADSEANKAPDLPRSLEAAGGCARRRRREPTRRPGTRREARGQVVAEQPGAAHVAPVGQRRPVLGPRHQVGGDRRPLLRRQVPLEVRPGRIGQDPPAHPRRRASCPSGPAGSPGR